MEAKSIVSYHSFTPELLFENGTKLKPEGPEYSYGEARVIELASVNANGLAETAIATHVILLKANGDNWFLLYEGDEVTEEALHSLDADLSELLDIDIEITVDLLNVFLQPQPDEGLVERMMLEISKVWYLNFLKNETGGGHEMTDGSDDYESDGYVIVPGVKRITKDVENEFWEKAFCRPFHSENDPFPSAEQAEDIAAKLLKIDDLYSAGIPISALIEAVRQGTYRSMSFVFQLLLFGINPNRYKLPDGNTALHVAVKQKNEVMVKLLLAFKADPNIKNEIGEIPIDLAADKKNIFHLLEEAATGQTKTREYFASNANLPEETRTGTYLMSLDGGGIRGFNSITFLIALEERMKELSPKCRPIHNYFDYIAGTSSGAITALTLLYTNHSLRIGRCLVYQILMKVIDLNHIDERKKSIERNLQSIFKEKVMSSLKGPPHAIVTTTKHPEGMLCLMTSYESNSEVGANHHVWKAARMSSAAPLIFPPVDGKYYDGGLIANDPTNAALGEINEIQQNCEFGCVLSIGTGSFENAKVMDNVRYFCWNFPSDQFLKLFKAGQASMMISNYASAKELSNEKSAKSSCETKGWEYHRWSPPLPSNLGSACKELNVIIDMMYHTEMHILQNRETINNIAKCILARKTGPN